MRKRANINNIIHADIGLRHGYTLVPNIVLDDETISNNAQLVYTHILKYGWGKGHCYPGHATLAQKLKLSVRSIIRALKELKNKQLIDWKQRGLNKTNIYMIEPLSKAYKDEERSLISSDMTPVSYQEVSTVSRQDTPPVAEKEYKGIKNIKNMKNNNMKLTLDVEFNTYSEEAVAIAKELNDLKSIRYYQKLISRKNKGIVNPNDFKYALDFTRVQIRTAVVDGTKPLSNPAGLFVKTLKDLQEKRKCKEQLSKLEDLRMKFLEKSKF
jgi:hypothetical protein